MTAASIPVFRYPILGADRVYAGMRWALLLIVLAFNATATDRLNQLWPLPLQGEFGWAFSGYVAFTALATMAVVFRNLRWLVPWLYAGDLLGIAALAWWSPTPTALYESLFFLPLVAIALRFSRRMILVWSAIAIGLEVLVLTRSGVPSTLDIARQSLMLLLLPMLVSILAEQWSSDNRSSVEQAESRSALALRHAEQYRDRMRALYEVAYTLTTTAHATHVLRATLHEMARLLPYQAGAILLPAPERDYVVVAAGQNLAVAEHQSRFAVGRGPLGMILRGSGGGVLPAESQQEELKTLPSLAACTSVLAVPMRSGLRTYGLALFGLPDEQPSAEQLDMATALVSYSLVALQNAQLIDELRTERNSLLRREEETRHQLNRDLHDGPAQALAAITMNLEFIKRLSQREPENVSEELDKLGAVAARANRDVRTLLFELRPLVLETQGLLATLRQYVERFQDQPTEITVEGEEGDLLISKRAEGTLFNIVQEALTNAIKHAKAEHIWIRIQNEPAFVQLLIQDDGAGFDLAAVRQSYDQRGSFGLLSIEERARLVNGTADLISAPGAGTTVKVQVPHVEE